MDISLAFNEGGYARCDNVPERTFNNLRSFLVQHGFSMQVDPANFHKDLAGFARSEQFSSAQFCCGSSTCTHYYLVFESRDEAHRARLELNRPQVSLGLVSKMLSDNEQKYLAISMNPKVDKDLSTASTPGHCEDTRLKDGQLLSKGWGLAGRDSRRVWVAGLQWSSSQTMLDSQIQTRFRGYKT
ncbi:hypothetical protein ABVK25_005038 [Lepraria finkii]|uniref:Uncharacterized protein n=1 Tax=Lepraria finkii TaxID=1340010 RepID=A0ABR4BA48_9LECA